MSTVSVQTPIIYFDDERAAHVGSTFIDVEAVAPSLAPIAIQFSERPGVDNTYRVFNGQLYQASGTSRRLGEPSFLPPAHSWRDRICFWPRGYRMPEFTNGHKSPTPDAAIGSPGVMRSPMLAYVLRAAAHSIYIDNEVYTVDPGPRLHPDVWHLKSKDDGRITLSEYFVNTSSNVMAFRLDELEAAEEICGRLFGKRFIWDAAHRRDLKVFHPRAPSEVHNPRGINGGVCLSHAVQVAVRRAWQDTRRRDREDRRVAADLPATVWTHGRRDDLFEQHRWHGLAS